MSTPTPRTDAKLLTVAQRTSPNYLPEMVYADFARTLERELAAERAKVRTLRSACESICEEWGRNHEAPFLAGHKMDATATAALEKLEDAK